MIMNTFTFTLHYALFDSMIYDTYCDEQRLQPRGICDALVHENPKCTNKLERFAIYEAGHADRCSTVL
jgi:hypothetical protein